jgi:hypothetical protein
MASYLMKSRGNFTLPPGKCLSKTQMKFGDNKKTTKQGTLVAATCVDPLTSHF